MLYHSPPLIAPKETQILTTDYGATIYEVLIAVCLTLAGLYVFKFVVASFKLAYKWWDGHQPEERRPLVSNSNPENELHHARAPQSILEIFNTSHGGRDLFINSLGYLYRVGIKHSGWLIVASMIALGCFVALVVAGVFSERFVTNGAALWSSKHCGIWVFESENLGDTAAARADLMDREKESRAGHYVKDCYEEPNPIPGSNCMFFYKSNITYSVSYSWECPFHDDDVCASGQQSITFDTGLVRAADIGVNSKATYNFRRSTTCAPLTIEYPYVQNRTHNGSTTYYYNYGKIVDYGVDPPIVTRNYTYSTTGDPFQWLVPIYDVR